MAFKKSASFEALPVPPRGLRALELVCEKKCHEGFWYDEL